MFANVHEAVNPTTQRAGHRGRLRSAIIGALGLRIGTYSTHVADRNLACDQRRWFALHRSTDRDDPSATGASPAEERAERAERRVAALEATERYLRDHVGALGARLVAAEQANAELMSARVAEARAEAIRSMDDEVARCRAEIAHRDLELAALRDELVGSRHEAARAGEEVAALRDELVGSRHEAARAGEEVAALRDELVGTRRRAGQELALVQRESDVLRGRLNYVTGSKSWRATQPARDVYRRIRRLLARTR
jgi:hypothetical protein